MTSNNQQANAEATCRLLASLRRNLDEKGKMLLKIHICRAYIHVQSCQSSGECILDTCRPAGDLYCLLEYVSASVHGDEVALLHTLKTMVESMATEKDADESLSLLVCELATMTS
jgi:hypothetical protein